MPKNAESPINAATRFCAVYGRPVIHSASPAMQNAGLVALNLNWRYLAFEVHPENLREAIAGAKAMKFIGLNLTVPHKLLALKMCDALDPTAKMWGAVNTICFEAKTKKSGWIPLSQISNEEICEIRSHGFNTDADAIAQSLRQDLKIKLNGAKILLLGAGGAGRVAALKLAAENVSELFLVNRTRQKAEVIAVEIQQRFPRVKVKIGYPKGSVDLMINGTSLGLKNSDSLPFDASQFSLSQTRAVYDMIYRPAETPLLRAAKKAGCRAANGMGMLLYQGAKALELWSGKKAPIEIMRKALAKNIYG
ncbi:MAG: shikimate dehydrogenase family protein [Limisphaerales bacterium]